MEIIRAAEDCVSYANIFIQIQLMHTREWTGTITSFIRDTSSFKPTEYCLIELQ